MRQAARVARSVLRMGHPAVRAMLTDDQAPTCSLVEFVDAWDEDPNLVWQVRTRHLIHLLEAAVARIEALERSLAENEGADVADPLSSAFDHETRPTTSAEPLHRREKPQRRRGRILNRRREGET
jgi:hypothetical protein